MSNTFKKHQLAVVNDTTGDHWFGPEDFKPLLRNAYTDSRMRALEEVSFLIIGRDQRHKRLGSPDYSTSSVRADTRVE